MTSRIHLLGRDGQFMIIAFGKRILTPAPRSSQPARGKEPPDLSCRPRHKHAFARLSRSPPCWTPTVRVRPGHGPAGLWRPGWDTPTRETLHSLTQHRLLCRSWRRERRRAAGGAVPDSPLVLKAVAAEGRSQSTEDLPAVVGQISQLDPEDEIVLEEGDVVDAGMVREMMAQPYCQHLW